MDKSAPPTIAMVKELGIIPYQQAPAFANGFLNDAAKYAADGCYVMDWAAQYAKINNG